MNPVHQMRESVLLVPLKQFIFLAHGERRQAEAADFLMKLAAHVGVLNRAGRHFIRVICLHCACFRRFADIEQGLRRFAEPGGYGAEVWRRWLGHNGRVGDWT